MTTASVLTARGCLHAAFLFRESVIPATAMKEFVNAVEHFLRDFVAIDLHTTEETGS